MPAWTLRYNTRNPQEMQRFLRESENLRRDPNCTHFTAAESPSVPHQVAIEVEFRDTPSRGSWDTLRRNHAEAVPAQPAMPGTIIRPNLNGDIFMGVDPAIGPDVTVFHTFAAPGVDSQLDRMRREIQEDVDADIFRILETQARAAEAGGWRMSETEGVIGINPRALERLRQTPEFTQEVLGQFQTALEDPDFTVLANPGYDPGYVRVPPFLIEAEPRVNIDDITQRRFSNERRPLPPPPPPPAEPLEIVIRRTRFERLDEED